MYKLNLVFLLLAASCVVICFVVYLQLSLSEQEKTELKLLRKLLRERTHKDAQYYDIYIIFLVFIFSLLLAQIIGKYEYGKYALLMPIIYACRYYCQVFQACQKELPLMDGSPKLKLHMIHLGRCAVTLLFFLFLLYLFGL